MEVALAKIRPQTSSSLAHQAAPANLLAAIETTLNSQKSDGSPTAYFAALLTTLESSCKDEEILLKEGDLLPAELYLLCLIAPFVPVPVVRTHLSHVLDLTAPLFPLLTQHNAPALRSQLGLYNAIFKAVDHSQLNIQGIRQCFASILDLCLDLRPKVRKRAQDVVKDVLASPPTPLAIHPYASRVSDWIFQHLSEASTGSMFKKERGTADKAIHILALLRPVIIHLPPSNLPQIASLLLSLPRLGDSYVAQSSYSILAELFSLAEEATSDIKPKNILDSVLSTPPSKSDQVLAPAWSQVLGEALAATYSKTNPTTDEELLKVHLSKAHAALTPCLESSHAPTRKAAAQSYRALCACISSSLVLSAVQEVERDKPQNIVLKLITFLTHSLAAIGFIQVNAIPDLLEIAAALFQALGNFKVVTDHLDGTAAEILLLPFLRHVSALRVQKTFAHKETADQFLGVAMKVVGPEVIFRDDVLPLNLIPNQSYLPYKHFVAYFVPLSEQLFELQQTAELNGREGEAKIWVVLLAQIWNGMGGYVRSHPGDISAALTTEFAQLLSNLLYSQVELRPAILKALRLLVEGVLSNIASNTFFCYCFQKPIGPVLESQSESWLAVFFNLYGNLNAHNEASTRTLVGEVIIVWASICSEDQIAKAFSNVLGLFKGSIGKQNIGVSMDLFLHLLPYLTTGQVKEIFSLTLSEEILNSADGAVVKRAYRLLGKIVEIRGNEIKVEAVGVLERLNAIGDEGTGKGNAGAKKDRLHLLCLLVSLLPSDAMHMIPSLVPEAVLGTKEPSEKARTEAFELIVAMGKRMEAGGVVKMALLESDDAEMADAVEAPANAQEFLTMIAGGLAGGSPHMISASITAISRVVFEFKDTMSHDLHGQILSTILVFLTSSANREIIKSTLGYIKLAIHTLPLPVLHLHLQAVVQGLLKWSGDRKNHFKMKVRHIFERLLRRFSWGDVHTCLDNSDGEGAKVLFAIKKRKDRVKRKKAARANHEEEEKDTRREDVLYGSESELDDSEDELDDTVTKQKPKAMAREGGARLRIDDDDPMDLLGSAGVTHGRQRKKKAGQDAGKFRTDDEGRIVIEVANDLDNFTQDTPMEDAYKESLVSVDGFTRGPNGRVKFNKDTKKRRREATEEDLVDMDASELSPKRAKKKEGKSQGLGSEFKAKRAGGDTKKGGIDPYAYVSLGQAAKRGSKGIAGKKK
ncbi:NUC173-domain-containing protein [Flagelloscypha sp. PMI_526]|nr:NUC173-domain-containing protein [Flagelloscypha sp. PMI_526]